MQHLLSIAIVAICLVSSAFGGWSDWAKIPDGEIVGEPSVVITKDGTIHVMARGTDDALWWTRSPNGGKNWYGNKPSQKWTKVGGLITSSPSCMQPIPNVVECYVRNAENGVSQIDYINKAWGNWFGLGGVLMTNVSAAAPAEDSRIVFGIAANGLLARREWTAFGSLGWLDWAFLQSSPGLKTVVSCGATGGNSAVQEEGEGQSTSYQWACLNAKQGGKFSLARGKDSAGGRTFHGEPTLQFTEYMGLPATLFVGTLGDKVDIYFVAKDKQMKYGTYNVKTGWTGAFNQIGNGTFTSGASCARGPGKTNIKSACAGRGGDGAVWISFNRPDK